MLRRALSFFKQDLRETLGSNPVTVLAGVAILLTALALIVAVTLLADNAANSRRDELAEDVEPFAVSLSDLEARLLSLSADVRGYALTGDAAFSGRYEERRSQLIAALARLRDAGEQSGFAGQTQLVARDTIVYMASADATFQAARRGDEAEAERLVREQNTPRLDAATTSIADARADVQAEVERLRERIRDIDSVERFILFLAGPLGIIAGGVLVWLALTNQRLLRNARTEQARFTSIVNSISRYGICQTNPRGEIEFCNPAAAEMLGYETGGLIGRRLHELTHYLRPDGSPFADTDCEIERVRTTGISHKGQDSFIRADTRFLPVDVTSEPIRVNGRVAGAVVAFEDITQRLRQEQFRQQFVSFASHELRTPLMIMNGYVQVLAKRVAVNPDAFDERSREAVRELEEGVARMRRITEVVLDLTRIESGQSVAAEAETVDLLELLRREIESVKRNHPEASIELVSKRPSVFLESDPARVGQVLSNLLDNAAKYGGDPPRVTVTVEQNQSSVEVRVKDSGAGIPEEERPLIFEQFYRGAGASNTRGLGVGLFITRHTVERLGGSLRFESSEGEGTEFTLTLPVATT
jgi:PAS domain S-box-containing protein